MTFRVQYVSGTVPAGALQHVLTAPTHFQQIGALTKAFILPATTMPTVGLGAVGGSTQMRVWALNCDISTTSTILLNRGDDSNPTEFAFWIVEYIGAAGGPNEFIMRGKRIFAFAPGALTQNSNSIGSITDANRCVPFISGRHDTTGTSGLRHFIASARMHVVGPDNVIQLTRSLFENGEPTYVCYCVEFTGSNWGVQTGTVHNWSANTNQDTALTAFTPGTAWLHWQFRGGNRDTPAGQTNFAWLVGNDILRSRTVEVSIDSDARYWVITNSGAGFVASFTHAIDGTLDIPSEGGEQSRQITVPTNPDAGTLVTGWLGSSSTTTTENPSSLWRVSRFNSTQAEVRRTRSFGATEYAIQVVSFPTDTTPLLTLQPPPAVLSLAGLMVNAPVTRTPAPAQLQIQTADLFSQVARTPAPAALRLLGNSVIPIAIYPGVAMLAFENAALGDIPKTMVLDIPMPAIDYDQKINAPPTIIIGTILQPQPAALAMVPLQHAATEGGDITVREPATAVLTFTGQLTAVGLDSTTTAGLLMVGLEPTMEFMETTLEPGVGRLNAPGFEARPVGVFIPHQWIDVEPAPVVNWS